MDLDGLVTGGVGIAIGTAANWLYGAYQKQRDLARADRLQETADQRQEREDEEAAQKRHREAVIAGYEDLLRKVKADLARVEARQDVLSREHSRCEQMRARADERIAALEEALQREGIPFRPWNPDGSGLHAPLPPDAGEARPADRRVADDPGYRGPERRRRPAEDDR